MANYELANDMVDDIMITVVNNAGAIVPAPAGDVFTVLSSDATMVNAIIATMPSGAHVGTPSLRMNALHQLSTAPVTVTVSDSSGLQTAALIVDVVADLTAKAIALDVVDAIHTPQPLPPV